MKKILIIFAALSVVAVGTDLKDGRYRVKSDKSIWFWYPVTEIVVRNGEVVEASHDRIRKDGRLASLDKSYNKKMMKKTGSNPKNYSKDIPESYFKAGKDLDKMDNVAGATDSVTHFKNQIKLLLKKAEAGETGEFEMSEDDLK